MDKLQIIDYSSSFLTFRIDTLKQTPVTVTHKPPTSLNNARIQLDCCCWITELDSGKRTEFVLGASCKTEKVGVPSGIWTHPNADFMPMASDEDYMAIKTFDRADKNPPVEPPLTGIQSERQIFKIAEAFDSLRVDLCRRQGEVLDDVDAIIEATFANDRLIARTTMRNEMYEAAIEYPIKTMNVNEREKGYQTDTGPVLLPNLAAAQPAAIEGMQLAFAAFNCRDWTEFIVRDRSRVADGIDVYHYCRPVRVDCTNQVIRLVG